MPPFCLGDLAAYYGLGTRCDASARTRRYLQSFSGVSSVYEGAFLPRRGRVIYSTVFTEPLSTPAVGRPQGLALTTALPGLPRRHNGIGPPLRGFWLSVSWSRRGHVSAA